MLLFSLIHWLTFCFTWHVHVASHMLTCLSWSASLHHKGLYCGYLNLEWCDHGSALNGWQKAFGWASGGGAREIQSALEAWLRSQGSQDVPDAEGMPSVCFTFSFPQDMNAKEGTSPVKPVECLVQTYILSCFHGSFNSWIVVNSTSKWWLVSLGFPLSHACCHPPHLHFHMLNWHLWSWRCIWHIYCPLSLLACLVGFSRSHVVPLASGGTTQQKRALKRKIHRSMTIEPPNLGQSSFTQTIYNLAGVKRSYPKPPWEKTHEPVNSINMYIYTDGLKGRMPLHLSKYLFLWT